MHGPQSRECAFAPLHSTSAAKEPDSQRMPLCICDGWPPAFFPRSVAYFLLFPEPDAVGKGQTKMTYNQTEVAVNARLLKVGLEVFPVYGDETSGFSVDPGDLYPQMPVWFRYQSLDVLFFALVNLNLSPEGQA
jgi:hypothetical protein